AAVRGVTETGDRHVGLGVVDAHEGAVRGEALDVAFDPLAQGVLGGEPDEGQRIVDRLRRRGGAPPATTTARGRLGRDDLFGRGGDGLANLGVRRRCRLPRRRSLVGLLPPAVASTATRWGNSR